MRVLSRYAALGASIWAASRPNVRGHDCTTGVFAALAQANAGHGGHASAGMASVDADLCPCASRRILRFSSPAPLATCAISAVAPSFNRPGRHQSSRSK
jgi:hypothetical protein